MATRKRRPPFAIATTDVPAGRRAKLELPIATLMSGTPVALPVIVLHGRTKGPVLWLSAAIHGDEICGVEIIHKVLAELDPKTMAGTLIAVPVVNVHGFNTGDRYLPDRRDLNRSFPGSKRGSLAARVADLMMAEIVRRCDYGIDLHTGAHERTNLPQLRADLDDENTRELAAVFGAPVMIHARTRDGSLREAATEAGAITLLYEGGEASRFDQKAIESGVAGVRRVLRHLAIVDSDVESADPPLVSRRTVWSRAGKSGILDLQVGLGQRVEKGEVIAPVFDAFGKRLGRVTARISGVIIGHTQNPLVNRGDAVAHIAQIDDATG